MPDSRFALTDLADDTLRRIAIRQGESATARSTLEWGSLGRHLVDLTSHTENALVDSIAYTESFCSERLKLIADVKESEISSWIGREKAWLKHGKLKLSDAGPEWPRLRGYVEIRNAIQHGLGRLTDMQLSDHRRLETLRWVRASGVYLDGDQVRLTGGDVTACFATCTAIVIWLDINSPAPPPPG